MRLVLVAACIAFALAQLPPKRRPEIFRDDLKYLRCSVCELAIGNAFSQGRAIIKDSAKHDSVEAEITVLTEKLCNPEHKYGKWLTMHDVVLDNGRLMLEEQEKSGKCKRECQTLVRRLLTAQTVRRLLCVRRPAGARVH